MEMGTGYRLVSLLGFLEFVAYPRDIQLQANELEKIFEEKGYPS